MSVGFTKVVPVPSIPERLVWTLHKGGRCAEARTRITPLGPELRVYVAGDLRWWQVIRDGSLTTQAEERRQAFIAKGWTDVE